MRFDRDRRGYETTALVQPAGRGRGKRLLYWFRTPPGVRVGRAPIDETAIRLLEEHNPDVQFDWTRILKAPQPEPQSRRDARDGRDRDQRGRREPRPPQRDRGSSASQPQSAASTRYTPAPESPASPGDGAFTEAQIRAAEQAHQSSTASADTLDTARAVDDEPQGIQAASNIESNRRTRQEGDIVEPSDAGAAPVDDAPPVEAPHAGEGSRADAGFAVGPEDVGSASYVRLGAEGLVRLRARYAEVLARIAEHPAEEDVRVELKSRAERLNPDAWVTTDEVTAALEQYETVFEEVRGVVDRHSQRRRPRG